jgi:hypothetical protein
MNSFAMIFGHCVWIPPSPKAALVALGLFFGIGVTGEPDVAADEAIIAEQYVAAGKTQAEATNEVAALNTCFASYEAPVHKLSLTRDVDKRRPRRATLSDRR